MNILNDLFNVFLESYISYVFLHELNFTKILNRFCDAIIQLVFSCLKYCFVVALLLSLLLLTICFCNRNQLVGDKKSI